MKLCQSAEQIQKKCSVPEFPKASLISFVSFEDLGINKGQRSLQGEREARIRRMVEPDYEKDGFFCSPPGKINLK